MANASKDHYFTLNPQFRVVQQAGEQTVERTGEEGALLGLDFPVYRVVGLSNKEKARQAELELLHRDLVWRILQSGDGSHSEIAPRAYTTRLLNHHYKPIRSVMGKIAFLRQLQNVFAVALAQQEQAISTPSPWDYEVDPELNHLIARVTRLEEASAWVIEKTRQLKLDRLKDKGVSVKVISLAYKLLCEYHMLPGVGRITQEQLIDHIVTELDRLNKKGSASTVANYVRETNEEGSMFINTQDNYDKALVWIESQWPELDVRKIKRLPRRVKGR